ncbi:MAG: hypothetical protein BWY82_01787 [Verrucomicrobia bacterium ADurb.Bin474]|nr:MAG: hypothetical protein BWY82_01787 [Verrucomicrobia bacterium ADurb.Bin474]
MSGCRKKAPHTDQCRYFRRNDCESELVEQDTPKVSQGCSDKQ